MTPAAIATSALTKRYGRLTAVDRLDLEVQPGDMFGFLGVNGSGKTTTIRVLLDLLRPTAGRAWIFGRDCHSDGLAVRSGVGYMPSEPGFYDDMTGDATLALLARLGGRRVDLSYQRRLLDRLELPRDILQRRLREYSTGMRRKLAIVQAFQGDPPLLVLDEPTEGLDPLMQEAFYTMLAEAHTRGRTVFMSSHVLSEVERVCTRIALVRAGRLAIAATVDEIRRLAPRRIVVTFTADVDARVVAELDGCEPLEVAPRRWILGARGSVGRAIRALAALPVADVTIHEPRLEEVLADYYRNEPAQDGRPS
jgi:ABC-2 type transport system ATP-binding protein